MADFHLLDVFAEHRYAGNQLAVVIGAEDRSSEEMLAITREFDFSETTFVVGKRDDAYDVRIFTPGSEIPFAGHPTIGTASVLRRIHGGDRVVLNLGIGRVAVDFESRAGEEIAWMQPPMPTLGGLRPREAAAELLSLQPHDLAPDYPVQEVSLGIRFLMVPVVGRDALVRARLDLAARDRLAEQGLELTGVYLFCRDPQRADRDVACRMLFDANGVREDPATGSACACLGGWAAEHGYLGSLPVDVAVEQGHEIGRPSLLFLRITERDGERCISVGGRCIPVGQGKLL
jgi:trans-2,3-dihydro-3-hydroxyanthranilate isomerase